jgi:hypothetical protein
VRRPGAATSRLFRRHVPDDADQDHQDHTADGAAGDIADPALDGLPDERADQLPDDAAADGAGDGVAERAERVLLGRGAGGATANRAGDDLNDEMRLVISICAASPP